LLTDYHSKYLAYEITKRAPSNSMESLASAIASAQVDLNPHQVDAALFAFQSPLSKGGILADEVGLGKTIEAGLIISQRWAERRRRILIIVPSNLRKQWNQELAEKFFLPSVILESKSYKDAIKGGQGNPFLQDDKIIICSYNFARNKASEVEVTPWDLVVIDEAHRLRNVYKPTNVIANALKQALEKRDKLLLTATPLQNSLLELYGLASFIDDQVFGSVESFREQFVSLGNINSFVALKNRIKPICHRTLRRQVSPYISYTKRIPIVEEFSPEQNEEKLYDLVSDYLRRPNLYALPPGQRALMTLVLRKLLASSTFAIAGALTSMAERLKRLLESSSPSLPAEQEIELDYEAFEETTEEWPTEDNEPLLSIEEREALQQEISDLEGFATLANSIHNNTKGVALLKALNIAFKKLDELNAPRKAIIFTESRKTQNYLVRLLADSPHAEGVVLFNGTNTDEGSKKIYKEWYERHKGSDKITGSKTADMRSALVDYFREKGKIMIATEAGAEGINLQFCSLVVNYDLPWNPQRIEQRIGRCHRYGQKYDVVVVNFLNKKNAADQRVYQLLAQKFLLFDGVFGASDQVLGAIESGVDIERRISDIYQDCRQAEEIKLAFDSLQNELGGQIDEELKQTSQKLLENFDDEVREKLRVCDADSKEVLNHFEKRLIALTKHELDGKAHFISETSFELLSSPFGGCIPLGTYELPRRSEAAHLYRLNHPLAEAIIKQAKERELTMAEVQFSYKDHQGKIFVVEELVGTSGWLSVSTLQLKSLDKIEEHVIVSAIADNGKQIDEDAARRFFTLPGQVLDIGTQFSEGSLQSVATKLREITEAQQKNIETKLSERNIELLDAEASKLDGWADDLKVGLERELKDLEKQIKEARRQMRTALALESKVASQKEVKRIEALRNKKRISLFEAQDEIDNRREKLIDEIESNMNQGRALSELFLIRWSVV
jgi:adenine-specific DNA-methyltransferase